jgi:hypothetical protein
MKAIQFIFSCVLLISNLALFAQPTHAYELNNSFADTYGGNAMVPNGGMLTSSSYVLNSGQGPNVSNVINPNNYSIVMRFTPMIFTYANNVRKILDFKNKTSDDGLYLSGGYLFFSPSFESEEAVVYTNFPATVALTRNGVTKQVTIYCDGIERISFFDDGDMATFTGPGNIIRAFLDDETNDYNSEGPFTLDYFRIYNYVVTDPEIINPSCGSSDSDCDGISNSCDVCPGGEDIGPCNVTSLPPVSILSPNWLCSNNNNTEKILICHQGATMCVSENAANTHLSHGDFLGPCTSCQNYALPSTYISPDAQNEPEFSFSPNPASDEVIIEIPQHNTGDGKLFVYDQLGKLILLRQLQPEEDFIQFRLDENVFASGIYYVSLVTNGEIQTKRFVIAR